jgi:hypothetical protein
MKKILKIYDLGIKITHEFDFLHNFRYKITDVNLHKLHTPTPTWALGPYAEAIYVNDKNRSICIDLYDLGFIFVFVKNLETKESFSYDDYIKYKKGIKISDESTPEKKGREYINYYINLLKASFEGALKEVILGNTWVDVPCDWQGMK